MKAEEVIVGRSEKMSKSKKNTVEPAHIVESYGADVARLFMLSDTPPSRDLEWAESGIDGCWKYVNRLWRLVVSRKSLVVSQKGDEEILRLTHKTIASVKDEFEKNGFNRAIAKIREFSNALEKFEENSPAMTFALKNLAILISPIMPHLAEEMWEKLGFEGFVCEQKFPEFDPKFLVEDSAQVAIQVCGKLRAVLQMPRGLAREELEKRALENENVKKFIEGKEIKKIIVVPDKLVNVVV